MGNQPPAGRINSPANDIVDDIALASFNGKANFLSVGQAADLPKAGEAMRDAGLYAGAGTHGTGLQGYIERGDSEPPDS